MRILIHDFGAYPFSVELSRELAQRGHTVRYVYLDESGAVKGEVRLRPSDPASFSSIGIVDVDTKRRDSFARRLAHDLRYSFQLVDEMRAFEPDLVLSADCPLFSQFALQRACAETGARFVFWLQDLFGEDLDAVVSGRSKLAGTVVSAPMKALENSILQRSSEVIGISPSFVEYVEDVRPDHDRIHLLPNWAPLTTPPPDISTWGTEFGLPAGPRVLYAGTLGLKHDPQILADIAQSLQTLPEPGHVVVVSEGAGRAHLEAAKAELQIDNLFLLDYQPAGSLQSMFASADVLVAALTSDSSSFSVPSKILAYMNSGRAVLGILPKDNYSAEILDTAGAGVVVDPDNRTAVVEAARSLLGAVDLRVQLGKNARTYAEKTFDISAIADQVEQVCKIVDLTDDLDLVAAEATHHDITEGTRVA